MTFDELKLAIAVHRADLGGADWTSHRQRYEAACVIYSEWVMYFRNTFFPFKLDVIERVRMQVRKNRAHNNQRREMSIEEYLASDLTT